MQTIRKLREERGWTQLELAIELGVTPVTVYNWERGRYEPKVSQFRALARVFWVSMDDIALADEATEDTAASRNNERRDRRARGREQERKGMI